MGVPTVKMVSLPMESKGEELCDVLYSKNSGIIPWMQARDHDGAHSGYHYIGATVPDGHPRDLIAVMRWKEGGGDGPHYMKNAQFVRMICGGCANELPAVRYARKCRLACHDNDSAGYTN